MMMLNVGWEEKLIELNKKSRGMGLCEGKPVKNRIKEIYKLMAAGQAVVVDTEEAKNGG